MITITFSPVGLRVGGSGASRFGKEVLCRLNAGFMTPSGPEGDVLSSVDSVLAEVFGSLC